MPFATVHGVELCYETSGDRDGQPLLLVHGYGAQLIQWPDALLDGLADRGFYVIRYDNRDVGLSTKFDGQFPVLAAPEEGSAFPTLAEPPPYTLRDMALDGLALLDDLGFERAHIAGASLGGTIVQRIAIDFPARVLTLTSIMSSTGAPDVPGPTPDAAAAVFSPAPANRDEYIDHLARTCRVFYGPHYDEKQVRASAAARFGRCYYPEGMTRQLAALLSDGDRTAQLANVGCPSLVVHGRADTLVPLAAGEATAAAIPGAELAVFDEMGHDLPDVLCPEYAERIAKLATQV